MRPPKLLPSGSTLSLTPLVSAGDHKEQSESISHAMSTHSPTVYSALQLLGTQKATSESCMGAQGAAAVLLLPVSHPCFLHCEVG